MERTNNILKELESLYNVLDLMNNNIISSFYKNKLVNNINELLKELESITK